MTLYIAGPMRGYPAFNAAAFRAAATRLRSVGYAVLSPVELDEGAGWNLDTMTEADLPPGWRRQVLRRDAAAISMSDGIALLDDWSGSDGTFLEIVCARFVGIPAKEVDTWASEARR